MKERSSKSVMLFLLSLALILACGPHGRAAAGVGADLAEQFLAKTPISTVDPAMTADAAAKAQEEFIAVIGRELGDPVGYKVGLTNPNMQKALGVSQPVRGTMLNNMMRESGVVMPVAFGSVPFCEGGLIVRVGDWAVNGAKTPEETLKWLDAVIPFTELSDMVFAGGVKLTAPAVAAVNVGVRYGVMGDPIKLSPTPEWIARLKTFSVRVVDEKGTLIEEGRGKALMGDPLAAVLWIRDSLAAEGKELVKGDLLSLGSLTKPILPRPGMTVRSIYTGLDPKGSVEISVGFEEEDHG